MKLPKHIPQLDVLRGLAVLEVMLYHASELAPSLHLGRLFRFGYTGVDLFFVLSGFLITGILIESKKHANYFKNFYARRVLRIWPLYYALLIFTFLVLPAIRPSLTSTIFERSHPWQSYLFLLQNLTAIGQKGFDTLRVTWSLAIEEQFYLVWPVMVWLVPRRSLKSLALSAVLLSMALRWSTIMGLIPSINIYTNTLTRLDGLGLGAFLAIWIPEAEAGNVKRIGMMVVGLFLPITIAVLWLNYGHWSAYALVSICFAGLLCAAINVPGFSRSKFLKYTGKISYALYLVHVPIFQMAHAEWFRDYIKVPWKPGSEILLLLAGFGICYGLATASWHFFESRFMPLKSRFQDVSEGVQLIPERQES
jgi:peptidoglycan/LPS O-acetylase OafA/YrhL